MREEDGGCVAVEGGAMICGAGARADRVDEGEEGGNT